jgi:hypothetical protein
MSKLGDAAVTLFEAFTSIGSQAGPVVTAIGDGILHLVDAFAKWAEGGGFQKFLDWVIKNGPGIVSDMSNIFKGIGSLIVALAPVGGVILNVLGVLGKFTEWLTKTPALFAGVILALGAFGLAIAAAMDTNPIGLIITAIGLLLIGIVYLATHWQQVWSDIKGWFDDAVRFLRSGFGDLVLLIAGPIAPILFLALHWQQLWNDAKTFASEAWGVIKSDILQPLADFFTITIPGAFNGVVSFFTSLPGKIASVAKGMWDGIGNAFIDVVNGIIAIWDKLHFTIGGGSFLGFSFPSFTLGLPHIDPIPQISTRAAGGDVTAGGTYLIGEKGPEILQMMPNENGYVHPNSQLNSANLISPATSSTAPAVAIGQADFHNEADIDGLMRQASFIRTQRRL